VNTHILRSNTQNERLIVETRDNDRDIQSKNIQKSSNRDREPVTKNKIN
jgi:hypothetical protein